MAHVYIMQTGQTTWQQQRRVESTAGAPLSEQGAEQVRRTARRLCDCGIAAVYTSSGEAEKRTAELLVEQLHVKVRHSKKLREMDFGLWQGLTEEEIKRRQPKIFRRWLEAPQAVRPPDGETVEEAHERIEAALREIVKKHKNETVLLVLRPGVLGVARQVVESMDDTDFGRGVRAAFTWTNHAAVEPADGRQHG